jgi:hypothetical protein
MRCMGFRVTPGASAAIRSRPGPLGVRADTRNTSAQSASGTRILVPESRQPPSRSTATVSRAAGP